MKKIWFVIATFLLFGLLTSCNYENTNHNDDQPSTTDPTIVTFDGTIEEINGQSALIIISSGSILSSGDKVMIDLSVAEETSFEVGDSIRVGYDGTIRESYPLQIETLTIEKIAK